MAKHDLTGAESVGDAILDREVVQPHHDMVEVEYKHYLWEASIGKGENNATASLLDNMDMTLDVANVFRGSSSIQSSLVNVVLDLLEFIVHKKLFGLQNLHMHRP